MKGIATFGTLAATATLAGLLAMPAGAQQPAAGSTSGATGSTNAATSGATAGSTSGDRGQTKARGMNHHHAHARMHAHGQHMDGMMSHGESAYRAELRHCVEGPADRRDGCLDQAIAHRGG